MRHVEKTQPSRLLALVHRLFRNSISARHQQDRAVHEDFMAPCKCRGTMRYVHQSCLDLWRMTSSRTDSFYRCEQCFADYEFTASWVPLFVLSIFTKLVTVAMFVLVLSGIMLFLQCISSWTSPIPEHAHRSGGTRFYEMPKTGNRQTGMHRTLVFNIDGGLDLVFVESKRSGRKTRAGDDESKTHDAVVAAKAPPTMTRTAEPTAAMPASSHATTAIADRYEPTRTLDGTQAHHTPISYANISYLLTGHDIDDLIDRQNDFLLSLYDLLKLVLVSFFLHQDLVLMTLMVMTLGVMTFRGLAWPWIAGQAIVFMLCFCHLEDSVTKVCMAGSIMTGAVMTLSCIHDSVQHATNRWIKIRCCALVDLDQVKPSD